MIACHLAAHELARHVGSSYVVYHFLQAAVNPAGNVVKHSSMSQQATQPTPSSMPPRGMRVEDSRDLLAGGLHVAAQDRAAHPANFHFH